MEETADPAATSELDQADAIVSVDSAEDGGDIEGSAEVQEAKPEAKTKVLLSVKASSLRSWLESGSGKKFLHETMQKAVE